MHITDPIADMLTRIRNANNQRHATVDIPASNMKKAIAKILLDEGYVKNIITSYYHISGNTFFVPISLPLNGEGGPLAVDEVRQDCKKYLSFVN